ncbi:aromatic compound catabolic protein [Paracidovorax avenae]|uniref:PaaI family thioesterase n=1 Tax=Paracidovorax avenae TaxID=80867 RepID=UPI000D15B30E|nr:PaaI family thioesterase [Paracidovorax avenae]AVS81512.1 aromatic compound catabolic protein [Paracidovorax avenae]AVT16643.1 aromatic compound catabolic protein [Paracidovorax avenae]
MDTHTHTHFQLPDATPSPALQAWLDEERAVQACLDAGPGPGVIRPEQAAGRNGLELMQAMLRGEVPYPPIAQTLDFLLISVGDGSAVFQGRPGTAHLNPMNGVHGGWFATLLDSALGCAVHTRMPPGRGYTTAELSINLVKGLTPRVPRVRAEGRVLHCGRQLATAEARLMGADGTLYAHATTTCLVFDMPGAR